MDRNVTRQITTCLENEMYIKNITGRIMTAIQKIMFLIGILFLSCLILQDSHSEEVDASKVMEVELERLAHRYSIEVIGVMQEFLPAILDKIASDLRQEADKRYKCKLLEDSGNECK